MSGHTIAEEIAKQFTERTLNEANTRHQIIDRLLKEVLGWPVSSLHLEEKVHAGYIDYELRDRSGNAVLLIEAKREGAYFELPSKLQKRPDASHYVRLRQLATDPAIAAAVNQAAQYCPSIGCQHACVSNGHEFIFFRSFIPGKHFLEADALVVPSLKYFSERNTEATNLLGYAAVTKDRAIQTALGSRKGVGRELHFPKDGIKHYDSPFQKNPYARFLEPIAKRYFGEIKQSDRRMMEQCYVFARDAREVHVGIHKHLADSITPYFKADGAENISDARSGGKLSQRIAKSLKGATAGEVLILYGGKGAGKSTFLRRLLYHEPPQDFVLHAFPIVVDFLTAPQSKEEITQFLWDQVIKALNLEGLLERPIADLQKLFSDRFEVAERQQLAGFDKLSPDYIRERNKLIEQWKSEKTYVARRLKDHWGNEGKYAVVAFDNTDQLPPLLQDHCFLLAQNIARDLNCVTIISMREERYCRARTAGVLDAYQNAGFHLSAPDLAGVFTKRIRLVIHDLEQKNHQYLPELPEDVDTQALKSFFHTCLKQFGENRNALKRFLQECSRDNMRLALHFFTQFLASGYTHVEEMVDNPAWTVIEHQVIKPMMIPQRHNYDETKSLVPNLYQCRNAASGSHFTAIRLLKILRAGIGIPADRAGYHSVAALVDEFDSRFSMTADCEAALDIMLRHGLIEANNRLDCYCVEKINGTSADLIYADEVRITAFGTYMLEELSKSFTYLDLVSLDCGLSHEGLFQEMCNMAANEREYALVREKHQRLDSRLRRTKSFIKYLRDQETREKTEFLLQDSDDIVSPISASFEEEEPRVRASAQRNLAKADARWNRSKPPDLSKS